MIDFWILLYKFLQIESHFEKTLCTGIMRWDRIHICVLLQMLMIQWYEMRRFHELFESLILCWCSISFLKLVFFLQIELGKAWIACQNLNLHAGRWRMLQNYSNTCSSISTMRWVLCTVLIKGVTPVLLMPTLVWWWATYGLVRVVWHGEWIKLKRYTRFGSI